MRVLMQRKCGMESTVERVKMGAASRGGAAAASTWSAGRAVQLQALHTLLLTVPCFQRKPDSQDRG